MLKQKLQKWRAFFIRHALDASGMRHIDIQRFAASFRMGAHNRVLGSVFLGGSVFTVSFDTVFTRFRHVSFGRTADTGQTIEQTLHRA